MSHLFKCRSSYLISEGKGKKEIKDERRVIPDSLALGSVWEIRRHSSTSNRFLTYFWHLLRDTLLSHAATFFTREKHIDLVKGIVRRVKINSFTLRKRERTYICFGLQ
ncbi:hypothetical protein CEXT_704461 [Caerostris extrusa]|uniref:Uncharacterized protein n=1 Tax=Caerostris extrusa TaxID=172846 RepID=A0AAV4NUL5_CAEEX|nr:hypothetical protein CEXT_704461 [Caerostris extrusa]